jgi:hypothetical protein
MRLKVFVAEKDISFISIHKLLANLVIENILAVYTTHQYICIPVIAAMLCESVEERMTKIEPPAQDQIIIFLIRH